MPKEQLAAESKRARFERIAERRVNAAIRVLRLIGNLADRRNYEYADEHVQQLMNALEHEFRLMKARFRTGTDEATRQFKFKGGR